MNAEKDLTEEDKIFMEKVGKTANHLMHLIRTEVSKLKNNDEVISIVGSVLLNLAEMHYGGLNTLEDGKQLIDAHAAFLESIVDKWLDAPLNTNKTTIH